MIRSGKFYGIDPPRADGGAAEPCSATEWRARFASGLRRGVGKDKGPDWNRGPIGETATSVGTKCQ
jgi:hypothetical protein